MAEVVTDPVGVRDVFRFEAAAPVAAGVAGRAARGPGLDAPAAEEALVSAASQPADIAEECPPDTDAVPPSDPTPPSTPPSDPTPPPTPPPPVVPRPPSIPPLLRDPAPPASLPPVTPDPLPESPAPEPPSIPVPSLDVETPGGAGGGLVLEEPLVPVLALDSDEEDGEAGDGLLAQSDEDGGSDDVPVATEEAVDLSAEVGIGTAEEGGINLLHRQKSAFPDGIDLLLGEGDLGQQIADVSPSGDAAWSNIGVLARVPARNGGVSPGRAEVSAVPPSAETSALFSGIELFLGPDLPPPPAEAAEGADLGVQRAQDEVPAEGETRTDVVAVPQQVGLITLSVIGGCVLSRTYPRRKAYAAVVRVPWLRDPMTEGR
jgi:hypothetical protein